MEPTRPPHAPWRSLQIELVPPPGPPPWAAPARPRYALAAFLFVATLFTTTTLGAVWFAMSRTDMTIEVSLPFGIPMLTAQVLRLVWSSPVLLAKGLSFSLAALTILLCHEMGHYLACRRYRLPSTLPYFLPVPFALGTFGAFIRIRAPIRSKRELFDVGIAGPIAGFVALVPFLLYGIAHSRPAPLRPATFLGETVLTLVVPGESLAVRWATELFHGPLPSNSVLDLHPFALAAWFGLLATALNLLPLGQLDGGHILYAVVGRHQRRLAILLWVGLVVVAIFWPGWILWCLVVALMGLRHPPVRDETEPLDGRRRLLALAALAMLALSFMPEPARILFVEPTATPAGLVASATP